MTTEEFNAHFEETTPEFPLGSFVYQPYEPQKAGIVISIRVRQRRPETRKFYSYVCRRPDGTEFETDVVKDFRQLIADHERKLSTHRKLLSRLEEMKGEDQ